MDADWRRGLAGFHLGHRTTRDLDLFFRGLTQLDTIPAEIEGTLRAAALVVSIDRQSPGYRRLLVEGLDERTVLDLVAEPVPCVEAPVEVASGIFVDTPHEILVNKLCALLGRSALRDLVDVGELLRAGGDLDRALVDASKKDGGFSPPSLAWVLSQLPVQRLAVSSHLDPAPLILVQNRLVERLLRP